MLLAHLQPLGLVGAQMMHWARNQGAHCGEEYISQSSPAAPGRVPCRPMRSLYIVFHLLCMSAALPAAGAVKFSRVAGTKALDRVAEHQCLIAGVLCTKVCEYISRSSVMRAECDADR